MNDRIVYAEVIQAMKKARDREDNASDSDTSISRHTNRGNKLKRKAKHMSRGPLRQSDKLRTPKEKIVYNGYEREIISRNPPRVDADGDVIDNPDEDEDAELTDADENPYKDVKIEEILRPLTNAADLHEHASMAEPYRSRAIDEMIEQAKNMVFIEQRKLSKMQSFMATIIGDNSYVPVGSLETEHDLDIISAPLQTANDTAPPSIHSGPESVVSQVRSNAEGDANAGQLSETNGLTNGDHEMAGAEELNQAGAEQRDFANEEDPRPEEAREDQDMPDTEMNSNGLPQEDPTTEQDALHNGEDPDDESQPHRMTTRSRVVSTAVDPSRADSPPLTPKPLVHPLFVLAESLLPAPPSGFGHNRNLHHDLLRQTASYVQKQQEVVRQCDELYNSLLKARRYRDTVWQWCRAEGHVGEMSDGEDWIDEEQWDLDAYPKKGEEVEEEDETVQRRNVRQPRRAGGKA